MTTWTSFLMIVIVVLIAVIGVIVLGIIFRGKYRPLVISYAGITEKGERQENQDYQDAMNDPQQKKYCAALADGLGGHAGGRLAAEIAVKTILQYFQRLSENTVRDLLQDAIVHAHTAILQKASSASSISDMKTTCAVMVILDSSAYWATVGDSRIYILRKGKIVYKSKDHSVVQMLYDMGEIKEDEISGHPDRNRLLKTLGMTDELTIEIFPQSSPSFPLQRGDHLLLCTDGFWEYMPDDEIQRCLRQHRSNTTHEMVTSLLQQAVQRGNQACVHRDNATVHLIRVM